MKGTSTGTRLGCFWLWPAGLVLTSDASQQLVMSASVSICAMKALMDNEAGW